METRWIGMGAAVIVTALSGCGSSETSDGAGGVGQTTTTSSTGGNGLTCASYCKKITEHCLMENGQYTTEETCLASCPAFPAGVPGAENGNSLGCRTYHAGVAAMDPVTHCAHAGPGGDGVCGDPCVGYCEIALAACTGLYADAVECKAACEKRQSDVRYSVVAGLAGGNEVACLLYYAQEAAAAPDQHCADLAEATTPCREGGGPGGAGGAGGLGGGGGIGGAGGN